MKILSRTIVLAAIVMLVPACAPPAEPEEPAAPAEPTLEEARGAVQDIASGWDDAFNSASADGILALFGADPVMMPPNVPAREGADEIRGFLNDLFAQGSSTVKDTFVDVRMANGWACAHGTYTLATTTTEGAEPTSVEGKWMALCHRQPDGTWNLSRNIWNTDTPPAGAMMEKPAGDEKAGEMMGEMEEAPSMCAATPAELAEAFEKSVVSGNVAEMIAQHTPDAVRMPPELKTVKGVSALSAYFHSVIDNYEPRQLDLEQTGIQDMGDMATTWGTYSFDYTPKAGGEHLVDNGKWMVLSEKDSEGCWRQVWAIWNSDNPEMTAGS